MSQQSSSTSKTAQKKAHNRSSLTGLQRLLLSVLATGSALLPAALALALTDSPAPGTVIQNQATGSFTDPDTGTRNVESNIVEITVLEISGITVTPAGATEAPSGVAGEGPNQGDGTINTEDVVYFTFTITNIGNDPTQFFVPDNANITNGSLSGPIQILAYDTDGNSETTLPTPVDVPAGGVTTGNALGLPEGSIAPNGTVTVRVPVKANVGLLDNDPVTVVLGDTPSGNQGNQAYNGGANNGDVYTQDNQDGDVVDVPATVAVETEAAGEPNNGDATLHRQEASATQDVPIALASTLPPIGNSNVCEADYNLVYSGQNNRIFAVHVESGASLQLSGNALATANGLSTDHVNRQVYYGDRNTLYAWSPLTNNHVIVDNNFNSNINSGRVPTSISSGGAAFFNGSVYQGSDISAGGVFEIFKVDFVPGSNGLQIDSVTPVGLDALVQDGTLTGAPNWGDFIIDDTGIITANGNGGQFFWSYDLNNGDFIDLNETFGTNSQLAKDGQGRLWALGANDVFQVQRSGNNLNEVAGTRNSTVGPLGAHSSFDAAECVRGASSIGDFVWSDTNGDGVQDSGEDGIENVTVDLVWDLDGDGVIDADEPVLATRTTDANGAYDFDELIFGDYIINVTDTNTVLTDLTLTTSTETLPVTLAVGAIDFNDADFGYQPPGPVGGGPFICNSTFYITIGPGGGTNQQLFEIDRSTSTYNFNPLGPATTVAGGYPVDFDYNALAYNPTDNFIYGYINRSDAASGPYSPGNIIKISNDGVAVSIGAPTGGTITGTFFGATVLSDGTYVISSGGRFASIDLSTTPPTVINSEAVVAGVRVNDIAVDPRNPVSASGREVYAINENGNNPDRLVILDVTTSPPTIVSQAPNLTGFNHNAGSQFVDAFGTLYYRSNTTSTLYKVDSDSDSPTYGVATVASSAPSGGNHDGASCLFAAAMEKTVTDTDNNPIVTAPAGEVVRYVYKIATGNVLDISGASFEDDLRNVAGGPPVNSTFTGDVVVSNATGTVTISNSDQTLQISNLTLPGQDPTTAEGEFITITADVLLDSALAPGTYFNQAFLTSLPPQYPPAVPSDYPPSAPYEDPTPIAVTEPLPSDPNVLLVKRITAINRGLANEQSFDNSFVDVGAPDDADNAVNWPGPPTAATIGGGMVESFIAGLSDGADDNTTVGPRDMIEYSIPFLSDGDVSAQDVLICDRIPANTTFIGNAFNDLTPPFAGGGDRGIYLDYDGAIVGLTNANDGDEIASTPGNDDGIGGYYFPAGADPAAAFPGTNLNCGGPNENGAIVVDLSDIPNATGDGIPAASYGLIRFRVAVD